ncbi:MAG: RNA polymerase [Parcubacteria group bacterium]|nr:RNA polymerase [Parcubacteria group bacterium]|tara:strand:- start:4807 stop:5379 length:573 start_codon:yes stop_codon:yes gene_type:complete
MNTSKFEEKLLLLKLKKRDPEAFTQIYDLYVTPIYRFIYFKVATRQDAEDMTSEVFLKIWQYINDSDTEIENLKAFLYRTARNLVIDSYRKKAKQDITQDSEVLSNIEDERQQNFLTEIETGFEMKNIELVLRKLKDDYREVIILRYIEELTITEISKVLDKSKGSVRVILHRALKVIRELIKQDGQRNS